MNDNLPAKIEYARELAHSSLLPGQYRKQPANLLFAMEYGKSLGLDTMTTVMGVYVVEGKPTASADLIATLVRRAGHKLRVTGNDQEATAQVIRADDPDFDGFKVTWTLERAKNAGLTSKDVWKKYPAAMLRARAITEVARMAASECLHGTLYTPEEMGATVDGEGSPIIATSGEIVMGEIEETDVKPVITMEQLDRWAEALLLKPITDLKDIGLEINAMRGWEATLPNLAGEPTVRQVFVNRLGQDLFDAEVKGAAKPIWSLIKGFGLEGGTFTYTDGNEDVIVLLGEYCLARGKALPETIDPVDDAVTDNARQMQQAARDSWAEDAKVVLTDAGLIEGELVP